MMVETWLQGRGGGSPMADISTQKSAQYPYIDFHSEIHDRGK